MRTNMKNEFGKIPLPWANEDAEMANRNIAWENTNAYWLMSQDWNGTGLRTKGATIGEALEACNEITSSQHSGNRLIQLTTELRNDIVVHGSKHRKSRQLKKDKIELKVAKTFIL